MNSETLLHQEIEHQLKILGEMEVGTEEYKTAVDGLTKLMDRALEAEKIENEDELKRVQLAEDKKHRWIQVALEMLKIGVPVAVAIWGTNKTLKFEETGTVTTIMGRGFIQKLLPGKK